MVRDVDPDLPKSCLVISANFVCDLVITFYINTIIFHPELLCSS